VSVDLPDHDGGNPAGVDHESFRIPHREKIEWMVETNGWALEPVEANRDVQPPAPGYAYTIGFPAAFEFPDIAIFGMVPAAANGLAALVADALRGGTEIPLGVELVGLLDNELRCVFAPIALEEWRSLFATAFAWYRDRAFDIVQLIWPDRNGFLPYEAGFDQRLRFAQPVIGDVLV
jgi:hypothetical protein